jgi:MFS transporter, FSR family, fosmidomycin resistance protein
MICGCAQPHIMQKQPMDKVALAAIIAAHTSVDMHTISLATLLPGILTQLNLDYAGAAAIVSANSLVIALAQPLFGIFGDRKPIRWLVLLGCVLCGLAMVSITWLQSYWVIIAAAVLSGIGSALFHPEGLASARAVAGDQRVTATSWFFLGGNIGFGIGPLVVVWLMSTFGPHGSVGMLVPTLIGTLLLATQLRKFNRGVKSAAQRASQPRVTTAVILFVAFTLLLIVLRSAAFEGLKTFIPLYFSQVTGKSAPEFAPLLTAISLSGIVGTVLAGPLADRIGNRAVMIGAMAIASAVLFVFLQTQAQWAQLVLLAIFGICITAPWTISVTMVQDALPNNLGLAGGLTLGTAYGAAGIGVWLLGKLADANGLAFTMQTIAWIPLLVLALSFFLPNSTRVGRPAAAAAK